MRARLFPLFLALALTALAADGAAQTPRTSRPFSVVAAEWNQVLDGAEQYLRGPERGRERVLQYREQVQRIRDEATVRKQQAEQELANTRQLIEALGPVPVEGEAPEAGTVTRKREQFAADVAFHRARTAQAELALTRAKALDTAISASLRERLVEGLVGRTPLPFAPSTIAAAVPEFFALLETLGRSPVEWYGGLDADERGQVVFYRFALLALLAAALGWGARRLLLRRFGRDPSIADPSYALRLVAAVADAVARGIVPAFILGAFMLWVNRPESLVSGLFADAVIGALVALFFFALATALTRAVLAPELPHWTLTRLAPASARSISRRVVLLAAVFAVDLFFDIAFVSVDISPELGALYTLGIAALAALGILALVPARLWRPAPGQGEGTDAAEAPATGEMEGEVEGEAEAEPDEATLWATTRRLAAALAIVAVAAIVVGYGRLGWYLISNLLLTGLVLGALILARGLLRDLIGALMRSRLVREVLDVRHRARERIKFWFRAALNPVLAVTGFLFVAPFWGLSRADLARWTSDVIEGFEVGGVTISIADIGLGLATFLVVLALTRLLQRSLTERILPQTELEPGVRHSLVAGTGYVGLILAATLAVAVLGIDLTDIALIAGALSVGIGFGLQNVVNNFVSGLILLVERPIKVGDWVVIGDNEGFVKRITVRATELETWQYASVIIPNADILSSALLNWTHKDRHGRIEVAVGVAYGSPTERVREILLECAKAHPQVLGWPESSVLFDDFGASSLDFELRCYTGDVVKKLMIASDLRFAIDQRFREEGIEIPFPQRVVHYARGAEAEDEPASGAPAPAPGDKT